MNEEELLKSWKQIDQQMEQAKILNLQSWALNLQSREMMQMVKARNKLGGLATFKSWGIVLGILWIIFLSWTLTVAIPAEKIFYSISVSAIILFNLVAIVVYARQLVMIRDIRRTDSVVEAQENLGKLRLSTIQIIRILFLQIPFYSTWFYSPAMFNQAPVYSWIISIGVVVLMCGLSIWLFKNINVSNSHKKWFRLLIGHQEWNAVKDASALLEEVEEFRRG